MTGCGPQAGSSPPGWTPRRALPGFWQGSLPPPPDRPALAGEVDADVAIVGAGYTGLWTAWALLAADPSQRVVLVEAERSGFGASGRNGGWLSGILPGSRTRLVRSAGSRPGSGRASPLGFSPGTAGGWSGRPADRAREAVIALQRALIDSVAQVQAVCRSEGIDADIHPGGALTVATTASQEARLRAAWEEDREWGVDSAWLPAGELASRIRVEGGRAAVLNPHCARIQPAKLARGLASAAERRGAVIYEHSPVVSLHPDGVATGCGRVRAPWVVLATEGYTGGLPGRRRQLVPLNSSMIVTDPLPQEVWDQIGWAGGETLADAAHVYVYLQRTADGRIAIGGRGIPYRFGSRFDKAGACPPATAAALTRRLEELFPVLGGRVSPAAAWSGVLGVARDWCPAVVVEPRPGGAGGVAWAGGYAGDGVSTSNLAGRTLADLILGRNTDLTRLPWVGRKSRRWEPEPLRWLGIRGVYALYRWGDRAERRHPERSRSSLLSGSADLISGRH